jgi:hypothetical protein
MTISSTTNTVSYTGNGSTVAFAVNYVFFGTGTSAEIQVVEVTIATGAETVKSNGSDFTVSGGSGATGTVTAAIAPASTVKWVINRATTQTQETDYVENDPFPAESHEEALDRLTAIAQEEQRALDRTAQLPDGYTGNFNPTLPKVITGSTVLAFNAGATAFEIGPTISSITGAAASATAAASSATASASSAAAAAASYDNFDDRYLGQKSSDPSVDNDGGALITGALYFNTSNNVMMVYTGSAWVRTTPTSGDQTTINAVNVNASNINTVSGIASNVTTVAGIASNVTSVAGIASDVTAVAGDATDIGAVAAKATEIGRLGTSDAVADMNTLGTAAIVTDMDLLGTSANVTAMGLLGTSGNVTAMGLLGVSGVVTDMGLLGTAAVVEDMGILGTAAVVEDMGILGTAAVVEDMGILGTAAVVEDMGILGTAAVVEDMSILGTAAVVEDMSILGTTDAVADMNTLGTSAVVSDLNTVAGIAGDVTAVAAQVVGYDFSTTTAMADPGSGNVRFNNATLSSVSQIAIDDVDKNGVNQSAFIILWDDSTNTVKGTLVFRTAGGDVATFLITGLTDNSGWNQIAVTHVASSGTFSDGEDTFIGFTRAGDKGADGEGAGDVVGPGSATDNTVARYNSTTGKLIQGSGVTIDDSNNVAATGFTGTLDGILGSGSPAAASVTTLGLGGELSGADNVVSRVNLKDYGEVTQALGSAGGTRTVNLANGNSASATVSASTNTFVFSNPTASDEACAFTLVLVNGGSQTVNWPSAVDWPAATAPTLTTSGTDLLVFITIDGGTIWHGMIASTASA